MTTFSIKEFSSLLPETDKALSAELKKFNEKHYNLTKETVADHMLPLHKSACNFMSSSNRMRATVLEQLVESGILKLPTDEQKHSLNTILFCNALPS